MENKTRNIKIAIFFSLTLNVYFIYYEIKKRIFINETIENLKYLGINEESQFKKEFGDLLRVEFQNNGSSYLILSTWANFCNPCLKEIPWLDSICGTVEKNKIRSVFCSDMSRPDSINKLVLRKWKSSTFIDLNHEQISALHNLVGLNIKTYPINVIVDSSLNIYFLKSETVINDSLFYNTIKYLTTKNIN